MKGLSLPSLPFPRGTGFSVAAIFLFFFSFVLAVGNVICSQSMYCWKWGLNLEYADFEYLIHSRSILVEYLCVKNQNWITEHQIKKGFIN